VGPFLSFSIRRSTLRVSRGQLGNDSLVLLLVFALGYLSQKGDEAGTWPKNTCPGDKE
jgi:hypothetical protein